MDIPWQKTSGVAVAKLVTLAMAATDRASIESRRGKFDNRANVEAIMSGMLDHHWAIPAERQ